MPINHETAHKLEGHLKDILEAEIEAGNELAETYEGDWPFPNSIMIFLQKPFKAQIRRDLEGIVFRNVNDPHYWKAEYEDMERKMWLCCRFDGPNFEPL